MVEGRGRGRSVGHPSRVVGYWEKTDGGLDG